MPRKQIPQTELSPAFRGIFIPACLVEFMRKGILFPREAMLAATIDALDRFEDTNGKKFCSASNKYLANLLGLSTSFVSHSITKLVKLHLIDEVKSDPRELHSLIPENIVSVRELLRRGKKGIAIKSYPHSYKELPPIAVKSYAIYKSIYNTYSDDSKQSPESALREKKKDTSTEYRPLSKWLYEIISRRRMVAKNCRLSDWDRQFRMLVEKDDVHKDRVLRVLRGYDRIFDGKYTPKALSAAAFREKFFRIESAVGGTAVSSGDNPSSGGAERRRVGR